MSGPVPLSAPDHLVDDLAASVRAWDERGWARPKALVVSGSGLAVDLLPDLAGESLPLAGLLPFQIHSVVGHPLDVTMLGSTTAWPVIYSRGRIHTYQGHTAAETVYLVRLAALRGAEVVIQTNASGSLRRDIEPGELVLVEDHLNLIGRNPLRGEPPAAWGPRFPDMTGAYDPELRREVLEIAAEGGRSLHRGVYAAVAGPSYETPAEIRMLERLGADVVGMSTVLEVIAARHLGLRNLVISVVSNLAAGIAPEPLDHLEVLEAGSAAADRLRGLLETLLRRRMERV